MDAGLACSGVPPFVAAVLVAFISASPEILTAVRAVLANRMQPFVNIALGASLPTVILTVPVMEALGIVLRQANPYRAVTSTDGNDATDHGGHANQPA